MATFQDIINSARVLIQDNTDLAGDGSGYRYSDAELLVGANDAVKAIRKVRPDLFLGKFKTSIADYALTDAFPIGEEYKGAVRDYVAAYAHMRESEDATNSAAAFFTGMFKEQIGAI